MSFRISALSVPLALGLAAMAPACDPGEPACQPACRSGFTCVAGSCVSACNPPCGAGEVCTAEASCEPAGTDAAVRDDAGGLDGGGADDAALDEAGVPDGGGLDGGGPDAADVSSDASPDACGPGTLLRDGGGCDPYVTTPYGTWRPIAMAPLPFSSAFHTWTGSRMLVVPLLSGETYGRVFLYDPALDAWETVGMSGFPVARRWASFAWTGDRVAVWGGWSRDTLRYLADGALYDPASGAWSAMTMTAAPSPRGHAGMAWAGDRLVVFGGDGGGGAEATGAQYDPATRLWTPLPTAGAPSARESPAMVWTGDRLVVWGGCEDDDSAPTRCTNTGALYDPATETWSPMATAPIGGRGRFAVVWTGREMVVWGGASFGPSWTYYDDGARYDPATDTWARLPSSGAPARRDVLGVWTGVEVIPWGGWETMLRAEVGRWVAHDDRWTTISIDGAPGARDEHAMVWTGRELIVSGGRQLGTGYYDRQDGAAWRP